MVLGAPLVCALATFLAGSPDAALAQTGGPPAEMSGSQIRSPMGATRATGDAATAGPGLCEARTINYITHMLPQVCLRSPWAGSISPESAGAGQTQPAVAAPSHETQPAEAIATSFMSFEDWKEMMLRRAGQDPQELRSRKQSQHQAVDKNPPDAVHHAGLGEEDEISLDFDDYPGGVNDKSSSTKKPNGDGDGVGNMNESLAYSDAVVHQSKDAGKTCKERFSYASFDAGATILKVATGAKNARAILVENKDTYMLLECAAPSKYIIVELSDDILIDTVVLANFEFFSSMIRHFRVSVSDRYPVKEEKWRLLGLFETRNSRDIQPFLVENPQIWAKYVRLEFLTHYGNEYYCPLSLLRIHGSRMLDSWKDSETSRDDDIQQFQGHEPLKELIQGDAVPNSTTPSPSEELTVSLTGLAGSTPRARHSGANPFDAWFATCRASEWSQPAHPAATEILAHPSDSETPLHSVPSPERLQWYATSSSKPPMPGSDESTVAVPSSVTTLNSSMYSSGHGSRTDINTTSAGTAFVSAPSDAARERGGNATAATTSKSSVLGAATGKPRASGPEGPLAPSPTVQEGFFNSITKRLQQVESNLTLSLKYVEDQSRHVQEALLRGEKKQHSIITHFLDDLNRTVLSELRIVRDQYDQIWQSTVLTLETQADRSERDMMALSARLNLLADEVVFQKRMAIVQAGILLSCLFLVIFSKGGASHP